MAGIGKLLASKSRRRPHAIQHIGLAPLTATFEGGELRALFRRREDARRHPHFRRALAARSFPPPQAGGAGGTSPFVRTGVVMPRAAIVAPARSAPRLSPQARGKASEGGAG